MKKIINRFINDFRYSFDPPEQLGFTGYTRISSSLTFLLKFQFKLFYLIYFLTIKPKVDTPQLLILLSVVIFIYHLNCIGLKHVFLDESNIKVLVVDPYRETTYEITEDNYFEAFASVFRKNPIVKVYFNHNDKEKRIRFKPTFRFFEFGEHPIGPKLRAIFKEES